MTLLAEQEKPTAVLEAGFWAGGSAVTWARAIGPDAGLTCVDSWRPYHDASVDDSGYYEMMDRELANGTVFNLFRHNIAACGVADKIEIAYIEERNTSVQRANISEQSMVCFMPSQDAARGRYTSSDPA
jgi:hypothetical protein